MKNNYCRPTQSPLEKGVRGIEVDNQMFTMKNGDLNSQGGTFFDFGLND